MQGRPLPTPGSMPPGGQQNQASLHMAQETGDPQQSDTSATEAWFVPDSEDVPVASAYENPEAVSALSYNDYPTSTLPGDHVSGIREEPTPSAWGPNSDASLPLSSEDFAYPPSHAPPTPENRSRLRLFSSGANWAPALPNESAASPRSQLPLTEFELSSSPRFSAHRTLRAASVSSPRSPDYIRSSGGLASPPRLPASPPTGMPTSRPPITSPARDSYETTDGSNSVVSGSYYSVGSSAVSARNNAAEYSDEEETSSNGSIHSHFTTAQTANNQRHQMIIGSVPNPSSIVSPRGSGDLGAALAKPAPKSTGRLIPRTKSVALNPMQQTIRSGSSISNASSASSISSNTSNGVTSPTTRKESIQPAVINQSPQALQSIPAPIAAALNIVPSHQPEMKLGGDVHLLEWSWDNQFKHNFLKVSADHSSCTWSSATNYGLIRSNMPVSHRKTFIEIAKTRGISQYLYVGVARPSVDFNSSPAKLQFNPVTVAGEWAAVWIKTSSTGDRFGVLFDLDAHKLTVYRNGVPTYNTDIPASFTVPESVASETDTGALENDVDSLSIENGSQELRSSSPSQSSVSAHCDSKSDVFPFIGMCGDQDILITDMPEFEKYETISWAHDRKPQFHATEEVLEGVPAILEMLGLGKLRPKFDGMSVTSFQKLKDADLRKLGTTVEQRRRLLSQIEPTK